MHNGSPKPFKLAEIAEMAECLRRGLGRPLNREELEFFNKPSKPLRPKQLL